MTSTRKLRDSSKNITKAMCEAEIAERFKFYDDYCLFVSVSPTAPPTFSVKAKVAGKRRTIWLGVYHPIDYPIEQARIDADLVKSQGRRSRDQRRAGTP